MELFTDEARQAVRYLIYEEMRRYRPSAARFPAPVVSVAPPKHVAPTVAYSAAKTSLQTSRRRMLDPTDDVDGDEVR